MRASDIRTSAIALAIAFSFGCAGRSHYLPETDAVGELKTKVGIDSSAAGWHVRARRSESGSCQPSTVLVGPTGREFNMGQTFYPDTIIRSTLCLVTNTTLRAQFLVLHTGPACSAAVPTSVFYLRGDGRPLWAATVLSHLESLYLDAHTPNDWWFEDVDGDGVEELVDEDVGKWGGRIIYHRFGGERFSPYWIEIWQEDHERECGVSIKSTRRIANFTHRR